MKLTCLITPRIAGFIPVPSFKQLILRSWCSLLILSKVFFTTISCCVTLFSFERITLVSLPHLARSSATSLLFSPSKSFVCCSNSCPSWSISALYLLICLRGRGKRKTKSRRRYKVLDSFNQRLKESRGGKKGFGVGWGGGRRGVDSLRRATEKRKERRRKKNRSEKGKKRKSQLSKRKECRKRSVWKENRNNSYHIKTMMQIFHKVKP